MQLVTKRHRAKECNSGINPLIQTLELNGFRRGSSAISLDANRIGSLLADNVVCDRLLDSCVVFDGAIAIGQFNVAKDSASLKG